MVVKSDGTKWACQSCLKGHRVSGCTHTDRELTLVPRKGRPVTQCQHCRQERKKRSAHVKCDCGEVDKPHHPKEKCIHLREAEKSKGDPQAVHEYDDIHLSAVAEEQGCCCHHGGKCTCSSLKKESDSDDTLPHGPAVKPRLEPTKSEGSITIFQNGHHKPVHRKNHAAHECGMPYKVPMPRCNTDTAVSRTARRSVDSLALDSNMPLSPSAFSSQMGATFNPERRLSKSEQHSPRIDGMTDGGSLMGSTRFPPVDFSALAPSQSNQSMQSAASDTFGFSSFEPMSGIDGSYDPWSNLPSADSSIMPNNNPFGVWPTNNDNGNLAQPALTAPSSGTQSEIDENPPVDDLYGFGMPSIMEDPDSFNFNDFAGQSSPQSNRRSLPPNFLSSVFRSSDLMASALDGDDWQNANVGFSDINATKSKSMDENEASTYDAIWQMQPDAGMTNVSLDGSPNPTRPTSLSLGQTNVPSDEIFQQLFPGIDVNSKTFNSTGSSHSIGSDRIDKTTASNSAGSSPLDFGPMDETMGFTSQPWSDGSMSIPNDPFTSSYDLNQEFSNSDFTANWTQ